MSKRKTICHASTASGNIKVCVRVRPFVEREHGERCCVQMPSDSQVTLDDCQEHMSSMRVFDYDRAYWSCDDSHPSCATQQTLMDELGEAILDNAMDGFNNCLFAYGQTGSGKTHSVLGADDQPENRGLLPRILLELFRRIENMRGRKDAKVQFQCQVSYLEIYNEQIRDLLVPLTDKPAKLTVRNHPKLGTYVGGLTTNAVTTYEEVQSILDFGAKSRSVAATQMNSASSRSHCIFNFVLLKRESADGVDSEQRASVNLVDLAGSERQKKTGASGSLLKEGAMINQSLSNLALVINKLAASAREDGKSDFVPFRNSKLTHILQESLSGNSKTVMIAALSPALSNLDETLSTLKFAQTCKNVATKAVRNQETSASIAEELTAEITRLKEQLAAQNDSRLQQQLHDTEQLLAQMEKDYQAQIAEAREMEALRKQALCDMGLSLAEISGALGLDRNVPQLVNLSDDASLTGCLVYFLPEGEQTTIGMDKECTIVLQGVGMQPHMCSLLNEDNRIVTLQLVDVAGAPLQEPPMAVPLARQAGQPGRVLVNGQKPKQARMKVKHQDRLNLGHSVSMRLIVPLDASPAPMKSQGTLAKIEDDLFEILHGDEASFTGARNLIHSIFEQAGKDETDSLLKTCGEVLPLVEEGNLITAQVRPQEKLEFRVAVGLDVLSAKGLPEVLVSLYKLDDEDQRGNALHFYEVDDFSERLTYMRQVYQDSNLGIYPDFKHVADDPWFLCSHDEIQDLMLEVNNARDEASFNREKAEEKVSELGQQNARLQQELQSTQQAVSKLQQEISVLREKMLAEDRSKEAAAVTAEHAEKKVAALEQELLVAQGELMQMKESNHQQAQQNCNATEEAAAREEKAQAETAKLQEEKRHLTEELQHMKDGWEKAQQELELQKKQSSAEQQRLSKELKQRVEENQRLQGEVQESRSSETTLRENHEQLRHKLDTAQQGHAELLRSFGQLRSENDKLQKRLDDTHGGRSAEQGSSFWQSLTSVMCVHPR